MILSSLSVFLTIFYFIIPITYYFMSPHLSIYLFSFFHLSLYILHPLSTFVVPSSHPLFFLLLSAVLWAAHFASRSGPHF